MRRCRFYRPESSYPEMPGETLDPCRQRRIVTIASQNCIQGLSILVASLDKAGWSLEERPLRVYVPDSDELTFLPGCEIVRVKEWWKGTLFDKCRNAPALLKPHIMQDQELQKYRSILYLDGADIAVLKNPEELFAFFEASEASIGARPMTGAVDGSEVANIRPLKRNLQGEKVPALHLAKIFEAEYERESKYYNNGVIIWRPSREMVMFGYAWQLCCVVEALSGKTSMNLTRDDNRIVGDQHTFNLIVASRVPGELVFQVPRRWNGRGGTEIYNYKPSADNKLRDPATGGEVALMHAAGPHQIPDWIVDLATSGSRYKVVEGGRGLSKAFSATQRYLGQSKLTEAPK